ncbi:hypothetical protein ABPG72_010840 [Tetrahymena utriculariae]
MDSSVDIVLKKEVNQTKNNIFVSDRSSSNPKTHLKNSNIDLNEDSQKKHLFKKIYQINTQNFKQRQSDNIILDSRSQSSKHIDKCIIKKASVQSQQVNTRSVKQIVIKKQTTIESLNSSNDQLSLDVKIPQSARNFNHPSLNLCLLNNRIQLLESTNSSSKFNQYFFTSQKLLSNSNQNLSVLNTYFNQQNSNQSIDEKPAKKKVILRRDILNTSRGIEMTKQVHQQNNCIQKEIQFTDSTNDLRKYEEEDSDENITRNQKNEKNEKTKTESNIPYESENKFKGRNMFQFQTQIIKKVPKNTPVKLEEGQNIDKSYSIQEDILNLNLATTTCSSGNEELSPNYVPVDRKFMKIIKVSKNLCKYGQANQSEDTKAQSNLLKHQTNLIKLTNKKQNLHNGDQNGNLQTQAKLEQNQQEISQDLNQDHKKESDEEILANQLGIFQITQTENIQIKKLKILSQSEFNMYEAYQIKNLQQKEINLISTFIRATNDDNSNKAQMFNNVLNYKHFIQNQDSSLLIFPFQSNKTLKNLLQTIKLLNEQLVKIFFKDILHGLQQIYYSMKAKLLNFLDFDQIFIDDKYRLSVGLNINQSKIDADQIYLQYLSDNEQNNQQQLDKVNKLQFREECNIVQDFGFLILKSLLGPNYAIFEQNDDCQIQSLISNQINYKKCCLFHDIKFISEKNITDSPVQLKKANEITKFLTKNCSQQLQDILCGSLRYRKGERLNIIELQQYFLQNQETIAPDRQQINNNNNNQSPIVKLLYQQVQIKEKQQDTLQQKTQKLQLLIRLKLVIANSKSLFNKIQPQINYQKIQEKLESQLSQYLSITTQEIKNVINICK